METRPFCWSVTGRNLYVKSLMESFWKAPAPPMREGGGRFIEDFNRQLCVTGGGCWSWRNRRPRTWSASPVCFADGTLRVPVQATYELDQAPDALATHATRHTPGKLAIRIG